jgi:hypothetical protein
MIWPAAVADAAAMIPAIDFFENDPWTTRSGHDDNTAMAVW